MQLYFGTSIEALQSDAGAQEHHSLTRALGPRDLYTLEIGVMFSTGVRVFTRTASGAAW